MTDKRPNAINGGPRTNGVSYKYIASGLGSVVVMIVVIMLAWIKNDQIELFTQFNARIDRLEDRLDGRIERLEERLRAPDYRGGP